MKRLLALEASAGTGKTYALSLRYLALLFLHSSPYDIVAVTFTNKAAKEMQERVGEFLFHLDEEKIAYIAKELGKSYEEIEKKIATVRTKFLQSDVAIITIDAFVQKILRKFAYYAGVRSDFEIGEADVFAKFIEELDSKEFAAFIQFAKWYGSSKLERFFAILYEKDKELPTNFTKKEDNTQQVLALYKKLANALSAYATASKQKEFEAVYESVEDLVYTKSGSIKAWLTKEALEDIRGIKNVPYHVEELYQELKQAIGKYFIFKESLFLHTLFYFYNHYKEKKHKLFVLQNRLGFTDIKHLTFDILHSKISSDFLYFRLDSQIAHILIDEFQDTSLEDWKIFEPLVDEIASGEGARSNRSFFYVGDKKQAIYGFRGGMAHLFDEVAKRYGMDVDELDVNYRSKEEIVTYVNKMYELSQKSVKKGGYVEVCTTEDLLGTLRKKLSMLLQKGVLPKDIAILVYTNADVVQVADFLAQEFGLSAVTSSSKLIIHQPRAKAIIDLMKYFYHNKEYDIYLLNFLRVAGVKSVEEVQIQKPIAMIEEIARRYNLWDESVLLLMQEAIGYKDIDEFIQGIESCETQLHSTTDGIEVVTIHKSKGLAYEHTIVLDRLGADRDYRDKFIFDYEGLQLQDIKLFIKGREHFDAEYARILEKMQKESLQEKKNVAYVAITRAQESLIVLKKDKSKRLWFLEDTKRGKIVPKQQEKEAKNERKFSLTLHYYGHQEFIEEEDEFKPNDYEAIYRGEAIHKSFEVGFGYVKSRYGAYIALDGIQDIIEKARDFEFDGKKFREIPFVYKKRLGIIDLLIEDEESSIVIDYKSVTPNDESAYIKQVQFYKDALKNITKKDVRGFLLYLDTFRLKEV